ncbi:MAG: hypothetical protein NZM04_03710 [Methylacidiphilales bacterium]|nr:hypothetical protein [Candidatus Methylacidiphilales bacterium]MDW8348789.1 hypothetical protein [Verrucomicrobiae bacterium]
MDDGGSVIVLQHYLPKLFRFQKGFWLWFFSQLLPIAWGQYHIPQWGQDVSSCGQIVVESHDRSAHPPLIELVTHIRNELAPRLGLKTAWRDRILLRIEGAVLYEKFDPSLVKVLPAEPFRIHLWLRPRAYDFQLTATSWPQPPEELIRQIVSILIYEKALTRFIPFEPGDYLPALPLWLNEGLTQTLFDKRHDTWTAIVVRAYRIGRSPSLKDILGWKELSPDTLFRAWQQAHVYHLVCWLTQDSMTRAEFQRQLMQYIPRVLGSRGSSVPWPNPERLEPLWKDYLKGLQRPSDIILTWDQTAAELMRLQKVVLQNSDGSTPVLTTLDRLHEALEHPAAEGAIREKIRALIDLELRAQFAWRPVVASFREALEGLILSREAGADYLERLAQAKAWAQRMQEHRDGLNDYLNWFEVSHLPAMPERTFGSYFKFLDQLQSFNLRSHDPFALGSDMSQP